MNLPQNIKTRLNPLTVKTTDNATAWKGCRRRPLSILIDLTSAAVCEPQYVTADLFKKFIVFLHIPYIMNNLGTQIISLLSSISVTLVSSDRWLELR